ncbi:MAG: glycosyltransferase [Treponema sp.]|nr:glycosyltransferase [Treponema sp.]
MQNGGLRTKGITKNSTPEKPLITVVTVVYNGAATLEQTILSVVNQTYDNVEYIIIDGASTDGTLGIIKKYEDKIDYWQSEPDKGIYDAMNKGIGLATGEWINFMNAGDEFFDSNTISGIFINKKIPADVLYGSVVVAGNIVKPRKLRSIKYTLPFCHQSCFLKRCICPFFKSEYRIIADYIMFLELFNQKVVFKNLDIPVSKFDENGISSNYRKVIAEKIKYAKYNKRYFDILVFKILLIKNRKLK